MIVCLGTTPTVQRTMIFEAFHLDAVNRARQVMETASGKSINVARVARTLGADAVATGFLGGRTGQWIRSDLLNSGINADFIDVAPPTRTCVTSVDEAAGTSTELVEESSEVEAEAHERVLATLARLLIGRRVLVLSGSLTPRAPIDFYARCTVMANAAGAQVIIDGRGEPLERALAHRPALVKPNAGELAATLGRSLDDEAAIVAGARELIQRGAERVIITRGPEPMIAVAAERVWRVTGPDLRGKYPIGSGDSLAAGLAVAMAQGMPFEQMVRLGMACGMANALVPMPGHLEAQNVWELEQRVGVEVMEETGGGADRH